MQDISKKGGGTVGQPKKSATAKETIRRPRDPEAQEDLMISLAIDLAEQQLRDGTASSQVISHFLKLGSTKEKLEKQMLAEQVKLVSAKTEMLQSAKRVEELYSEALKAMKNYSGAASEENDEDIY